MHTHYTHANLLTQIYCVALPVHLRWRWLVSCNVLDAQGTHLLTEATTAPDVYGVIREATSEIATVLADGGTFDTVGYVAPELNRGDLLIYDSRTLHRGLGNVGDGARPVLIYRYDTQDTHPKDTHGLLSTLVFRHIGNALRSFGHPATAAAVAEAAATSLHPKE